ncbi:lipid-A-disaccharide synthase [Calditerrivibrio sp.]|uniref:lipid-A-disaccharide synthase n=1 Tax=Calditerrivibrio sp. TaxID=2792612 RepID=UPI003D11A862
MKKIFLIAGEESGDIHASNMIRQLRKLADFSLYGTGGNRLKELGQEQFFNISDMTIIGFNEVISKLPFILKMFSLLKRKLFEIKPDLVLLVDYPGFNLRFADFAKRNGFKVAYYIAPQVWAWHYSRIYKMRSTIDRLYCILPFEEELFKKEGINAVYVGNPIIDNIKLKIESLESFYEIFGLCKDKRTIGLLPGSRRKEVEGNIEIFYNASYLLKDRFNFIMAQADSVKDEWFGALPEHIKVAKGYNYDIMKYSDILWCCSGTATLEAAYLGTPPIIIYRVPYFTEIIGRYFLRLKRIGLPNIILNKTIFPELINKDFNPESLVRWTKIILDQMDIYNRELSAINNFFVGKDPSLTVAQDLHKNFF